MKAIKRIGLSALTIGAVGIFSAGCQTTEDPGRVRYIDPYSNEGVVTVGGLDFHDWGIAAEKAINSLLSSGVLLDNDRKSVVMISTVRNNTREHVDTDLLTKKIRISMLRSGQAIVTTAVRAGGPEDAASMKVRELRLSDEFDQTTVQEKGQLIAPSHSLSGKIIQVDSRAGNVRQSAFAFQLTLTDLRTGLAVWEDEVPIVKQGSRPGVGW